MKPRPLGKRGASIARTLGALGVAAGVVIAGCSDTALDLRPTLGNGRAGSAGSATGGSLSNADGEGGNNDSGGQSAARTHSQAGSAGTLAGGSSATGGSGGSSGGSTVNTLCGNGTTDPGEECDDHNTLSGDGCSAACKSSCEACEKNVCSQVPRNKALRLARHASSCCAISSIAPVAPAARRSTIPVPTSYKT